ncbi:LacI family DNA-binding transcriptional regulator [Paraburkholderia tropica]|uniref:LacI family DNA-binding transcriptional regulator n=1 Tax=Paraburkholderia tropica TaxID=92647 RepID=UPI002AB74CAA|nr:LacI family DNA-binding transcriptional regulator [Paraburkholderia tropica]
MATIARDGGKKFATLEDVAREAGLSRAQVSRALRGDPKVKPQTRAHVQEVAQSLGYRPNLAARNLVSSDSKTVGLIIGEPQNPFHIQLAQAIDRELARAGLDSIVSLRALDDKLALSEIDRMMGLRAAGIILISKPREPQSILPMAKLLPCVYLGKSIRFRNVSTVDIDDAGGVTQAVEHLIALGHKRIAHIAGTTEISAKERTDAYRAAMDAAGLTPIVFAGAHNAATGRNAVDSLMSGRWKPTAIFASNDAIALGAMDRLRGLGVRVPEDVSIIGFDDVPAAASETYSLSTVRQDTGEQARAAVAALQSLAFDAEKRVTHVVLPVKLVLRGSVLPLPHN